MNKLRIQGYASVLQEVLEYTMQNRESALNRWLKIILNSDQFVLKPLMGDASFRRYFRLTLNNMCYIIMDAPPEKEATTSFIAIAERLRNHGLLTPLIRAANTEQGFIILEDFGDALLLNQLTTSNAKTLYQQALENLILLQTYPMPCDYAFPIFDTLLILKELTVFIEWFVYGLLKLTLSKAEEKLIEGLFDWLCVCLQAQPYVLTHRDYHSRNIMVPLNSHPGQLAIIDFQDAVIGPITYDLVSLLKDCYLKWPQHFVKQQLGFFYEKSQLAQHLSLAKFTEAFDLCGLQRHLKVLGIFSRLHLRDNKSIYLNDLPRVLSYVTTCLNRYEPLTPLAHFFKKRIKLS